jgi:hypothetical protein
VAAAVAKAVPKFPVFATPNAAIDSTINNATNKAPCLSTFKTALGLAALAEDFDNITTKRTVFAPSDAAFKKLNLSDDTLQTLMLEKGADVSAVSGTMHNQQHAGHQPQGHAHGLVLQAHACCGSTLLCRHTNLQQGCVLGTCTML